MVYIPNTPYNNRAYRTVDPYRPIESKVERLLHDMAKNTLPPRHSISQAIVSDIACGYCPLLERLKQEPERIDYLNSNLAEAIRDAYFNIRGNRTKAPIRDIVSDLHSRLVENLTKRDDPYARIIVEYYSASRENVAAQQAQSAQSEEGAEQTVCVDNAGSSDGTTAAVGTTAEQAEINELRDKLRSAEASLEDSRRDVAAIAAVNARQARQLEESNQAAEHYAKLIEGFEAEKARLIEEALEKRWDEYSRERENELEEHLRAEEDRRMDELRRDADARARSLFDERLRDMIEEEHDSRNSFRESVNATYDEQAATLSMAKKEACDESARMQREMKKYLDDYMINFCTKLDSWRNSVYDVEVREFAQWYTSFYSFVDKLDNHIVTETNAETAASLKKIAGYARNLRKRLDSVVLPRMGLRTFAPQRNEPFDNALHVLKQSDEDYDDTAEETTSGLTVVRCVIPGVEKIMADRENPNILVKAEVEAAAKDTYYRKYTSYGEVADDGNETTGHTGA